MARYGQVDECSQRRASLLRSQLLRALLLFVSMTAPALASDKALYASAVDIDPWQICETLSDLSPDHRGMRQTTYQDGVFTCEGGGRREHLRGGQICTVPLGLTRWSEPIHPLLLVDQQGRPERLRCLFDKVDASCLSPTTAVPNWPVPNFASRTDDRCDIYRRGPVPETASSKALQERQRRSVSTITDPKRRALAQQILSERAAAVAEVVREPPRLLPLYVTNELLDEDGGVVETPLFNLRRLLGGRPTVAVTWWPGCDSCERLIGLLHDQDPIMSMLETDHPFPRVAILFPAQSADLDQQRRAHLGNLFPGRPAWAVMAGFRFERVNAQQAPVPQLLVFDNHGLLRATTYASAFDRSDAAGWLLAEEPAVLLNAALQDASWLDVPRQVPLSNVVQALTQGKLVRNIAEAPDRITLEPELERAMVDLGRRGHRRAEGREFGAHVLLDGKTVKLGTVTAGALLRVHVQTNPADFRSAGDREGCTSCSGEVRSLGGASFHTHPGEGWFSSTDLDNVTYGRSFEILALPSGNILVALATQERLRAYRPVNRGLMQPEREALDAVIWRRALDHFTTLRSMPAPPAFVNSLPVRQWVASSEEARPWVSYAALVAGRAATLGLALYIGRNGVLQKVPPLRDPAWMRSWTGVDPANGLREETGLNGYERVVIARLLRSLLGDKEAFCAVSAPDTRVIETSPGVRAITFTDEVRALIRRAAAEARKRHPEWPRLTSAEQGFLDDRDLVALLDLASEDIEIIDGHFMRRDDRQCLLRMLNYNRTDAQDASGLGTILAWGPAVPGRDRDYGSARGFMVDPERFTGMAVGEDAHHFGCANVALIQGDPFSDVGNRPTYHCDRLRPRTP